MTKSKGIKTPDWDWTEQQIALIKKRYLSTLVPVLAREIGCSHAQLRYKAHALGIKKPFGSMLKGRRESCEHREKIRLGMLKAHDEGRFEKPSAEVMAKLLEASLRPDVVARRAKKSGETMRGIPQRMDGLTAAAEHNKAAKIWTFISPSGDVLTFRNLKNFVRENQYLFDPKDVQWKEGKGGFWCRASVGLAQLFKRGIRPLQWKGWYPVSRITPPR